jgi:hypothetical protein
MSLHFRKTYRRHRNHRVGGSLQEQDVSRGRLIAEAVDEEIGTLEWSLPLGATRRPAPSRQMLHCGTVIVTTVSLALAGCTLTSEGTSPSSVEAPAAFTRERLIGRWGIASFHNEKDRQRTEREARAQCSLPYTIAKGPTDGVMMHVADDPKLHELRLKGDTAGRTYVGFEAPPGDSQDREIVSATDKIMVMRFVDPDANRRYGTFVYVRCSA